MTDKSGIFAEIRGAERIWAVAAIHGEAEQLVRLHSQLEKRFRPGDRLVYLGNYVGCGPASVESVDELLRFRRGLLGRPGAMACDVVYIRGRQEEMWDRLTQLQFAVNPVEVLGWMLERGIGETLEAYGKAPADLLARARSGALELARLGNELREAIHAHPSHADLFAAIRRAAYTANTELIFVHSGYDPARPLEIQDDALWWGSESFDTIEALDTGTCKVIRGLDPVRRGPRSTAWTETIDAGCGFGGPLRAVCFDLSGATVDRLDS